MKNGVAAIYFSDNEYGYDGADENKAEIFDFDLNPLKSFSFKTLQEYTVTKSRAASGKETRTKDYAQVIGTLPYFSDTSDMESRISQFANFLFNNAYYMNSSLGSLDNLIANATLDGTTIYITMPIGDNSDYPYQENLTSAKAFLSADDTYGYLFQYTLTVTKYEGEWTSTTEMGDVKSVFFTPHCVDVSNMNHWNGGVYLPFSQTFFNDDEKFEYVCYKSEISVGTDDLYPVNGWVGGFYLSDIFGITSTDRDGDGVTDYESTLYGIHRKGFEVVSEDGSVLYSFDFPDSNIESESIEFFKSDNYILAQLSFKGRDDYGNYNNTTRFYRIDKSSSAAPKLIREENHVSAAPNPASKGTPVVMTLPSDSSNARNVSVTSLNGGQVFSKNVDPGVSQVSIPTEKLSSGVYLFTVTEEGRKIETCKIIIK